MVLLHEDAMGRFLATWRRAAAAGLVLPNTQDPDYASLEAVVFHVLRAGRGYMVWMCKVLELPDPRIDPPPPLSEVASSADAYLVHLFERWRTPLAGVEEERFGRPEHLSNWKVLYCVDAMLEHAVMHPIRHEFQLAEMLVQHGDGKLEAP